MIAPHAVPGGAAFLGRSVPGFFIAALGGTRLGGHGSSLYDAVEIGSVIIGVMIVAVAGLFTIRTNVAKVWREQAEAEKARNDDLTAKLTEMGKAHAREMAELREQTGADLTALRAEVKEQHELKHRALADLAAANMRTDLTPVLTALADVKAALGALTSDVADTADGR